MNKILKSVFIILLFNCQNTYACTIFLASDGKTVLVGNNEDNTPTLKSFLWFYPAKNSSYGFVTWGNTKRLPEGGMNEKGLFWDAAAMPNKIPIIVDKTKENYNGYFVTKALSECATVDELLNLISKYNLMWQEKAQVLVADATGNFAIIHSNYIIRKSDLKKNYCSLANYCLRDTISKTFQCHRQGYAEMILSKKPSNSPALFRNILEKTAQTEITNATLYSQICDLTNGTFEPFQKYNFSDSRVLHLKNELEMGERTVEIKDYFQRNIADELSQYFEDKDFLRAEKTYDSLLISEQNSIDFSFRHLDDLGYKYIREKKYEQANEVFKLNLKHNPTSDNALASLGISFLSLNELSKAKKYFKLAKQINPNNHLSTIFNPREAGKIVFRINHFEGVDKLSLVGTFNDFKPGIHTFKKDKKGIWTCIITLKPGEYRYKLVVGDGNWYLDPLNKYLINPEKYWDNYLKVE
jgi:tetratricopeptide (TPR) repeat protein